MSVLHFGGKAGPMQLGPGPNCTQDADSAVYVLYVRYLEAAFGAFLTQAAQHWVLSCVGQYGAECLALVIGTVGVGHKEQTHAAGFELYFLDAQLATHAAQGDQTDKLVGLLGNLAETVLQAVAETLYVLLALHAVQLAVQEDSLAAIWHK